MSITSEETFFYCHIEGLPYIFFSRKPSNWSAPSGWTWTEGLVLIQGKSSTDVETTLSQHEGIANINDITLRIISDDLITLFYTRELNYTNHSFLQYEISAGDNGYTGNYIATTEVIANAPASNGTLYLDTQTITYDTKSNNIFEGCNRGRYASLDFNLNEITWKPKCPIDTQYGYKPVISLYPQRITDRVITLYRGVNFSDNPNITNDSTIIYRGLIAAYGLSEDYIGIDINCNSILEKLDVDILENQPTEVLSGIDTGGLSTTQFGGEITITEIFDSWEEHDPYRDMKKVFKAMTPVKINFDRKHSDYNSLISAINSALNTAYTNGRLLNKWFCRENNGRVEIGAYCAGFQCSYRTISPFSIAEGPLTRLSSTATGSPEPYGGMLAGKVEGPALKALGFDDNKLEFSLTPTEYLYQFSQYMTKSSYTGYWPDYTNGSDGTIRDNCITAESFPASVFFDPYDVKYLPVEDFDETSFNVTPNGSDFYVQPDEGIIYHANGLQDNHYIKLSQPNTDASQPIRAFKPIKREPYIVNYGEEGKLVRQVYRPNTANGKINGVHLMLLRILLGTGSSAYNTAEDVYDEQISIGIPYYLIDCDSFLALQDYFTPVELERDYVFNQSQNVKELINNEFKLLGCVLTVKDGRITAIPPYSIQSSTIAGTVDSSTRKLSGSKMMQTSPDGIVREISLKYDYDIIEDDYFTTEVYRDITVPSTAETIELENKGLKVRKNAEDTQAISEYVDMLKARLAWLSSERYEYRCQITPALFNVQVGDTVWIVDEDMIDPLQGVRGIGGYQAFVTGISYNYMTGEGELRCELLGGYLQVVDQDEYNKAYVNRSIIRAAKIINAIAEDNAPQAYWVEDRGYNPPESGSRVAMIDANNKSRNAGITTSNQYVSFTNWCPYDTDPETTYIIDDDIDTVDLVSSQLVASYISKVTIGFGGYKL